MAAIAGRFCVPRQCIDGRNCSRNLLHHILGISRAYGQAQHQPNPSSGDIQRKTIAHIFIVENGFQIE